ncbi:MAG: ATP-binding cassette domain-containing protein [Bacteroidales bacterium]|nr:ATP-binding cassette domain-containing protein [Bacteroidales bacterium]
MSEKILKALMQLFAIIARPQSNDSDRRVVVEAFLRRQLNEELVKEYLNIFDGFYNEAQERQKKSKQKKRHSAVSVRVLRITTQINDQLTQNQKIIVLVQLLEFCKSDNQEVSEDELEFIGAVADTFNVETAEYNLISKFVLNNFNEIPQSSNILLIDNKKSKKPPQVHHLANEGVSGQIWFMQVASAGMHFVRFSTVSEIYMNGVILHDDKVYPFNPGSSLRNPKSNPIYYSDIITQFRKEELQASRVLYEVKELQYRFKSGHVGLHNMSFEEESGRLVGIMGASGAGKSTLLNVLNGTNTPYKGEVLINGVNIHDDSDDAEGLIGYVSQDDLLIEELSVYQNLYYNAKLCFDNLTEEQINERVNNTLINLGLYEIKDMKVGSPLNKKISGGQRKRLNISLELIREPSILFLDEPTSGLSSRDSENILDLLKELALKGKLLFVVIHQPSSDIFKMFDRLVILDTGGYLIYNGDPIESIVYFKSRTHQANWSESECNTCGNVNPEQVFNIVEGKVLDEFGKATNVRKISPKEWNGHYSEHLLNKEKSLAAGKGIPEISFKTPNRLKQFLVFTKRDVLSKLADMQYLLITLLEAPLLAFALAFLIKYFDESATDASYTLFENSNLPVYLFMSVIIAIFMGLTVSAEEIIKDRKILKREAFLNLSWNSYLMSKVIVQLSISAIQALTFVIIGNSIMEIHGMWFEYWLVLFSCWAASNLMGLVISDSFKAVVTIYILIPFLVIPQIILSGIIVKFDKLNPNLSSPTNIPFYGEAIVARWGYEALAVKQFMDNDFEKQFYEDEKTMSITNFGKNIWHEKMEMKINNLKSDLEKDRFDETSVTDLELLKNEIVNELEKKRGMKYPYIDLLEPGIVNMEALNAAQHFIDILLANYKKWYVEANDKKDALVNKLEDEDREAFLELKDKYSNEGLEEFVTNSKEAERSIEFQGRIVQKLDPIFKDPKQKFIKSHFYAPRKMIFGTYVSTFWVNILVLWAMTISTYLVLYFRLMKRLLDFMEEATDRLKGKSLE